LGMALEEPQEDDNVYDFDGYKFAIDREFEASLGSVEVDYASGWLGKGFTVRSKLGSSCS